MPPDGGHTEWCCVLGAWEGQLCFLECFGLQATEWGHDERSDIWWPLPVPFFLCHLCPHLTCTLLPWYCPPTHPALGKGFFACLLPPTAF